MWGMVIDKLSFVIVYCTVICTAGIFAMLVAFTTGEVCFTICIELTNNQVYVGWIIFVKGSIVTANPGLIKIY